MEVVEVVDVVAVVDVVDAVESESSSSAVVGDTWWGILLSLAAAMSWSCGDVVTGVLAKRHYPAPGRRLPLRQAARQAAGAQARQAPEPSARRAQ